MSLQLNAVLIGVQDLKRSKEFYGSGLGLTVEKDYPNYVSFKTGSLEFGLYPWATLAADAGVPPEGSGFSGVTLHHVVSSAQDVDEVMAQAERAGAKVVKAAHKTQWGYFGYFSDLDGHLWKVASGS